MLAQAGRGEGHLALFGGTTPYEGKDLARVGGGGTYTCVVSGGTARSGATQLCVCSFKRQGHK